MLIGLLIGAFGGQFILERINIRNINVILAMQLKTRDLKHKRMIEYITMIIVGGILLGLMSGTEITAMVEGLIVGSSWALIMYIFEDTTFDRARNTLR